MYTKVSGTAYIIMHAPNGVALARWRSVAQVFFVHYYRRPLEISLPSSPKQGWRTVLVSLAGYQVILHLDEY